MRFWLSVSAAEAEEWKNSFKRDYRNFKEAERDAYRWAQLAQHVSVWDNDGETADRYTVQVGDHFWFMSPDANMPNGVCMYAGEERNLPFLEEDSVKIPVGDLPRGTTFQLVYLLREALRLRGDLSDTTYSFDRLDDDVRAQWETQLETRLDKVQGIFYRKNLSEVFGSFDFPMDDFSPLVQLSL